MLFCRPILSLPMRTQFKNDRNFAYLSVMLNQKDNIKQSYKHKFIENRVRKGRRVEKLELEKNQKVENHGARQNQYKNVHTLPYLNLALSQSERHAKMNPLPSREGL